MVPGEELSAQDSEMLLGPRTGMFAVPGVCGICGIVAALQDVTPMLLCHLLAWGWGWAE